MNICCVIFDDMELAGKESCTGCGACAYVCPKNVFHLKKMKLIMI